MNSDKQYNGDSFGLHPNLDHEGLQMVPKPLPGPYKDYSNGESTTLRGASYVESPRKKTILGLSITLFWILIFVVVVIIAGGVGAGIGAGLASQNKSNKSASSTR